MMINSWKVVGADGAYDMVKPDGSTRGRPYPRVELAQKAMRTSVNLTLAKWNQNGWDVGEPFWADDELSVAVEASPPADRLMPVRVHVAQSQHERAMGIANASGTPFSALMREALEIVVRNSDSRKERICSRK